MLKAFALLYKKHKNIRLKIAGADENGYWKQLNSLSVELGIHEAVWYCGIEIDMEKFYKSLDLFVLPSVVKEAFGLVLCEAMSCGVPVITTSSGAQEEIIEDGIDGFIIKAGDIEGLAQKVYLLYTEEYLRSTFKDNGKFKVSRDFNLNVV